MNRNSNRRVIALMGPPCGGKGVFHEILVTGGLGYGFGMSRALSTLSQSDSELRRTIEKCFVGGELVPDEIVLEALRCDFSSSDVNGRDVVTEGLFRSVPQFEKSFNFFNSYWEGHKVDALFVWLNARDEVCLERGQHRRNRVDKEKLKWRLYQWREIEPELRKTASDFGSSVDVNAEANIVPMINQFLESTMLGHDESTEEILIGVASTVQERIQERISMTCS